MSDSHFWYWQGFIYSQLSEAERLLQWISDFQVEADGELNDAQLSTIETDIFTCISELGSEIEALADAKV